MFAYQSLEKRKWRRVFDMNFIGFAISTIITDQIILAKLSILHQCSDIKLMNSNDIEFSWIHLDRCRNGRINSISADIEDRIDRYQDRSNYFDIVEPLFYIATNNPIWSLPNQLLSNQNVTFDKLQSCSSIDPAKKKCLT